MRIRNIIVTLILAGVLVHNGWGKEKKSFGEAISPKSAVVKLKKILEKPSEYKDKEVVLEGNFAGSCCATDFFYKERLDSIEVYPQGFDIARLKPGAPVRIFGTVRVIEKKAPSKKEPSSFVVFLDAKGVELR